MRPMRGGCVKTLHMAENCVGLCVIPISLQVLWIDVGMRPPVFVPCRRCCKHRLDCLCCVTRFRVSIWPERKRRPSASSPHHRGMEFVPSGLSGGLLATAHEHEHRPVPDNRIPRRDPQLNSLCRVLLLFFLLPSSGFTGTMIQSADNAPPSEFSPPIQVVRAHHARARGVPGARRGHGGPGLRRLPVVAADGPHLRAARARPRGAGARGEVSWTDLMGVCLLSPVFFFVCGCMRLSGVGGRLFVV